MLADRDVLMVLDDVWNAAHLAPFVVGGPRCARLITTRNLDVVPAGATIVDAGAMAPREAAALVASGLVVAPDARFRRLADLLGRWPLLLRLANGALRERVARHRQPVAATIDFVEAALERRGLTAFDARAPEARDQAIERTMAVSLELLTPDERDRYRELAVFPDATIPLCAVERLWGETGPLDGFDTEERCLQLARLSLLVRFDLATGAVELHDALRRYLRRQLRTALTDTHGAVIRGYARSAPDGWASGPNDGYFFQRAGYHLAGAGRIDDLHALLTDSPEWMRAQFAATRGDAAYRDDLHRAIALSTGGRSAAELQRLFGLHTARQLVHQRASVYEDDDLRVLVCLGREAEALGCARLRDDPADRAICLVAVATAHGQPARVDAAVLDESERTVSAIVDTERRSQVLDALSAAWVAGRRLVDARRLASEIHDPALRARAVARVGLALGGAPPDAQQAFTDALAIAEAVPDLEHRRQTLVDLADTTLAAGALDLARAVAR